MYIEDYRLEGGLNEDQIKLMQEKAIYLLEEVGVHIPHKGILHLLSEHDGVSIENEKVRFRSDLVVRAMREARYPLPDYARDKWLVSAGAHQTKVYDLESGKLRETTLRDLIDLIKLGDTLDTVGSAPVVPLDAPYYLQEILMHKIAWEYSRYRANDMFEHDPKPTVEAARYIYEMSKVAGKWFALGLYMISPRTFDRKELEVIYNFRDEGVPMWAGSMPIAGINAPITMKAALLQSMFETYGCLTMLNLVNRNSYCYIQIIDSFIAHPFDMKYTTFVYGSAEDIRCAMDKISIHKYLSIPFAVKSLLTNAKEPDAQAAFEVSIFTLMAALAGARVFRCAGLISSGEIYSAEMLVICREIIEYIKNLLKGEEFTKERLLADEIEAVSPGQSFIGRKSTLQNFKKEYWEPDLFIHSNLGQWREMGSKSIVQYAREIAKRKIKEHSYLIDEEKRKEMERILNIAKNDVKLQESFRGSM